MAPRLQLTATMTHHDDHDARQGAVEPAGATALTTNVATVIPS